MKLTQAQRSFIVEDIESYINDGQVYDHYEFGDLTITWVKEKEAYLVLHKGKQYWRNPSDIAWHIDDLADKQLVDWFVDQHDCHDWFEEYLEELMLKGEVIIS
jgi:hypothetical protein